MEIDIIPLFAMYYISIILHIVSEIPPVTNQELWIQLFVVVASAVGQFYMTIYKGKPVVHAVVMALTVLIFSSNIFLFTDIVKVLPIARPRLIWTMLNSVYLLVAFVYLSLRGTVPPSSMSSAVPPPLSTTVPHKNTITRLGQAMLQETNSTKSDDND